MIAFKKWKFFHSAPGEPISYMRPGQTFYYNATDFSDLLHFSVSLENLIKSRITPASNLIFLCIGSDRATGDSLGPVIGYKLHKYHFSKAHIHGCLDQPVHAQNLTETILQIKKRYQNPFIIAIDASLGKKTHIGYISLCNGGIYPGTGVNKELPQAGDISITGIVNASTSLNQVLLQTTRLNTVMLLADSICSAISHSYYTLFDS